MSYVYIRSEPGLWTVGHYDGDGGWEPESDHSSADDAASRVALLNGDRDYELIASADSEAKAFRREIAELSEKVAALEAELGRRRSAQRQTRPTLPVDADGIHTDSNTIVPRS